MKPICAAILSVAGYELTDSEKRLFAAINPVGVSLFKRNIQSIEQLRRLTDSIREVVGRDQILIAIDQEGGRVCRLEPPLCDSFVSQYSIGQVSQPERSEICVLHARLISRVLHQCGINMNFAPCLDIRYPSTAPVLSSRCFSDSGRTVAECGEILIRTYLAQGIIPCMKHLPGHGRATVDPHLQLPRLSGDWAAVEADIEPFYQNAKICPAGMTAHIVIPQIDPHYPVTQSQVGIETLIRQKIGFDGFLISDALEMFALSGSMREKAAVSISAGCDSVCYCHADPDVMADVAAAAGCLSDRSLERLTRCFTLLGQPEPVSEAERMRYQKLTASLATPESDYDAVEVLNQMCFRKK